MDEVRLLPEKIDRVDGARFEFLERAAEAYLILTAKKGQAEGDAAILERNAERLN